MIRFLFRFAGLWILAAAFVWLVIDGTKSIAGSAIVVTKLSNTWYEISPSTLIRLQPALEHRPSEWLWNSVVQTILEQPTWLVLGVLVVLFDLLQILKPSNWMRNRGVLSPRWHRRWRSIIGIGRVPEVSRT